MRIGMGYDVHRLVEDRDLILGGVRIPYEKGLLGHSDADVLLHAIMDALLGAAGFTGSGEGISAQAVAALETVANYSYTAASTEAGCAGCGGCPRMQGGEES